MFNYTAGPLGVESARVAAGVRTVITSRKFIEQAQLHAPAGCACRAARIVYLEDLRGQFGWRDKLWLVGFALRFPRLVIARQSTLDPAVVLFTSGSEDRPKGVVLSHHAIVANIAQMRAVFDFSPSGQDPQSAADVSRLQLYRGRDAAADHRHAALPLHLAAALPRHSRDRVPARLHLSCSAPAPSCRSTRAMPTRWTSAGCAT